MRCARCRFAIALLLWVPAWGLAQEDAPKIDAWLGRDLLEKNVTLGEVKAFTESRVPTIPEFKSTAGWERYADQLRQRALDEVVLRGEARRWNKAEVQVEWQETVPGGSGYVIKKLRYECLPGLWIPALLYEPEKLSGKVPVVLNVNGHDGRNGKAAKYKQARCINQAKRGMIALNVEWIGMGQLNRDGFYHYRMNQLDLCGTSGLSPHYLAQKKAIDLLLAHPHADPQRLAVAGLSGGGWQTVFISGLDTRVTLANPVAGYSSYKTRVHHYEDLGDSEQTPSDLATVVDYTHLTAMRAPRPTLLTFNAHDNCCFASPHALPPLLEAARPVFKLYGVRGNLRTHVNWVPGNHNFGRENREALYRMLGDFFYPEAQDYNWKEIPVDEELKTFDDLSVKLPENNQDFHTLALQLAEKLPQQKPIPEDRQANDNWQKARRKQLAGLVRFHEYAVKAEKVGEEQQGKLQATFWRLKLGQDWTVPVIELAPENAGETVLLIHDDGRGPLTEEAARQLKAGKRVCVVDLFYFGNARIAQKDFLFALLVAAVGERTLGIQTSQLAAVAIWLKETRRAPVKLVAHGPRHSLIALIAAALEPKAVAAAELKESFSSLKDILAKNLTVRDAPELFCFGLLEQFDIPQMQALVRPRPLSVKAEP